MAVFHRYSALHSSHNQKRLQISHQEFDKELLTNSIVHSDQDEPEVSLIVEPSGDVVSIKVSDKNQPIPEMEREVLTGEKEMTPLYHGSGMGLWLVKHIVKYADGVLDFQERDPQGNIVTIKLPSLGPE